VSFIGLKRDIKEGEYAIYSMFGHELIVKNENNKFVVAKNACKHRGYQVACKPGRGSIKCPHHGQRFEFERKYSHHEFGEFLFLPTFIGASKHLSQISNDIGQEISSIKTTVAAPFHLWVQHAMDTNAGQSAHPDSWTKTYDSGRAENVYLSEYESSHMIRINDETVDKAQKDYAQATSDLINYMAFPNLSVTSYCGVIYLVDSVIPKAKGCDLVSRMFLKAGLDLKPFAKKQVDAHSKVVEHQAKLVEAWAHNYSYSPDETQWLAGDERIKRYVDELIARGLS